MRVRMLASIAGPHICATAGQILDVPPPEARSLIEAGCAELADEPVQASMIETTAIDPPERAVLDRPRKRRGRGRR